MGAKLPFRGWGYDYYTNTILGFICLDDIQRTDGGGEQESRAQCALAHLYFLLYFGALYFIECSISFYRKYYRVCRGHYGAVLICHHADEFE